MLGLSEIMQVTCLMYSLTPNKCWTSSRHDKCIINRAFLVVQLVKKPPAKQKTACSVGDLGLISGLRRSTGGGHGNPPAFLPGEIPWTEEAGGLSSIGS